MTGPNFLSDINGLGGNKLPVEIPHWIMETLVLRKIAFIATMLGSIFFRFLALCPMRCMGCSGIITVAFAGLATTFSVFAVIFDLLLDRKSVV